MHKIYLILFILVIPLATYSQADFTFSTSNALYCAPQAVTFTENVTGNPDAFIWDFGDGTTGTGAANTHIYDFAGTYSVTLTAVYASTAASVTKQVTINPRPNISMSADRVQLCQPGTVNFTASSTSPISTYKWDFGDGSAPQTTNTPAVSHAYNNYGSFTVNLDASTAAGCIASTTMTVTVAKFPINVSVSPTRGCTPAIVNFNTTSTFPPGDAFQSAAWTFGDGSPVATTTTPNTTHTYTTTQAISNAMVVITSAQGCTNQYNFDTLAFGIPPTNLVAYTIADRDTFCGSETIQFYGKADNANSYQWDFGDGVIENTRDTLITYRYRSLGWKTITIRPFFNGCPGTPTNITIFISGVVAAFNYSNTCTNKNVYAFNNQSLGNVTSFGWTFTDQPGFTESTITSPSHTFPTSGSFVTKLVVYDNVTGCSDSASSNIYTAVPVLTSDKQNVCKDSIITYSANNTYPPGVGFSYIFHLTGNIIEVGGSSVYSIIPRVFGTFNDYLVIMDSIPGTCNDTLNLPYPITVRGPVLDFDFPPMVCLDSTVTFINNSYPFFPEDDIVDWYWSFGDGQKDSTQNPPPHLYPTPGQHVIRLEATDENGCAQHLEQGIIIGGLPSVTVFPARDTVCSGESIQIKAYTADSLVWDPLPANCVTADCDTILVSPTMDAIYIATAISNNGCKNNDTSFIKVYSPLNISATADQATVCPGTAVQLNASGSDGIIKWDPPTFLNSTTVLNPISTPYDNIQYSVVVSDSAGCFTDTAYVALQVHSLPVVDAGPDQVLLFGDPFTLSPLYPANSISYLWTPSNGLSCTTCASPSGTASNRQTYNIEITDGNGCKASDKVTIFVTCEKSNLHVPNAFTPNGDGRNDWFYPVAYGYKSIKNFSVYSRGGFKVFERQNFDPNISSLGWDGRIKGDNSASTQVFTWLLQAECDSGEIITTKGTVTLIR